MADETVESVDAMRLGAGESWNDVAMGALALAAILLGGVAQTTASTAGPADPAPPDPSLSVPAEFVRELRIPGEGDEIVRPTAIFVDRNHGETFVADSGHNRLVVFDAAGVYRYEFDCADHVGVVNQVVVDSDGFVYVLGTSTQGPRLLQFDFDGSFLEEIHLEGVAEPRFARMVLDADDRLYLLDESWTSVRVHQLSGRFLWTVSLEAVRESLPDADLALGDPWVHERRLYLPLPAVGTVAVVDARGGGLARWIGIKGSTPGQMGFPVAARVSPEGMLLVLDKMRFNVQCFTLDGRFLGEFGGKGFRNGWFYHPSLLAVDGAGRAVVGQTLDNRVQVCAIPRFIHDRYETLSPQSRPADDVGMVEEVDEAATRHSR